MRISHRRRIHHLRTFQPLCPVKLLISLVNKSSHTQAGEKGKGRKTDAIRPTVQPVGSSAPDSNAQGPNTIQMQSEKKKRAESGQEAIIALRNCAMIDPQCRPY
jgi:hypothetical protein